MLVIVNFLNNALRSSPFNSKIEVGLDLIEIQDLKKTVITRVKKSRPNRIASSDRVVVQNNFLEHMKIKHTFCSSNKLLKNSQAGKSCYIVFNLSVRDFSYGMSED